MKFTTEQMSLCRTHDPAMFAYIAPAARPVDGKVEVDETKIPQGPHYERTLRWLKQNTIDSKPRPWSEHDIQSCPCGLCVQERNRQVAEEKKRQTEERNRQVAAGMARLGQYLRGEVAGFTKLLDNVHNQRALSEYLIDPAALDEPLTLTPTIVDQFIAAKQSELLWTLPNGEEQLPLDASNQVMNRASVAQLRDLSKRRGEGRSWYNREGRISSNLNTGHQSQVR